MTHTILSDVRRGVVRELSRSSCKLVNFRSRQLCPFYLRPAQHLTPRSARMSINQLLSISKLPFLDSESSSFRVLTFSTKVLNCCTWICRRSLKMKTGWTSWIFSIFLSLHGRAVRNRLEAIQHKLKESVVLTWKPKDMTHMTFQKIK